MNASCPLAGGILFKVMFMKKIIISVIGILLISVVFAACSQISDDAQNISDDSETTAAAQSQTFGDEKNSADEDLITTQIAETPVEEAEISSSEASEIISEMSLEKLGLEGDKSDYKFMVSTKGKTIEGTDYIEIIASQVSEENEDGSISMETKGDYFISYDGKIMLVRDVKTGTFSELK